MIGNSSLPDEQKLLHLRKIMPLAASAGEKKAVISILGKLHIFPALVYTGRFLDDTGVSNEAARAVASIALPPSGSKKGMTGKIVRDLLAAKL